MRQWEIDAIDALAALVVVYWEALRTGPAVIHWVRLRVKKGRGQRRNRRNTQ